MEECSDSDELILTLMHELTKANYEKAESFLDILIAEKDVKKIDIFASGVGA